MIDAELKEILGVRYIVHDTYEIEKIKSSLIWKYGYYFKKLIKARDRLKEPDISSFEVEEWKKDTIWFRSRALLVAECLCDWFGFDENILETAIYRTMKQ